LFIIYQSTRGEIFIFFQVNPLFIIYQSTRGEIFIFFTEVSINL